MENDFRIVNVPAHVKAVCIKFMTEDREILVYAESVDGWIPAKGLTKLEDGKSYKLDTKVVGNVG